MTKGEAQAAAAERNRDPGQAGSRWMVRQGEGGEWDVVRIKALPGLRGPLKTTTESRPGRGPDDPRSPNERNLPGLPGGLGGA
jgi:hypothetical protein